MKIFNRLSILAMVSLIFVTAVAVMGLPAVKANSNSIYVDPPYQEVTIGTSFIVSVNVTFDSPGIGALSCYLYFDPNLLYCSGVTDTYAPGTYVFVGVPDNSGGNVWIFLYMANPKIVGSGTIANITLNCLGEGTSPLTLSVQSITPAVAVSKYNGSCNQIVPPPPQPVGGEVLTIDALPMLVPWVSIAGAIAIAIVLVFTRRSKLNY